MSNHIETLAHNIARAFAQDAADALEPFAGQPIDDAARERLADALLPVLIAHIPSLPNLVHA
ncbi:hypothetical protein CFB40_12125 [Burkholderia sp. AU31652]|uniref:hypothetical protein n=1 Tax=Burkholderia sp. AU31652 TaxID=2015354 RepID=UPI000B7ABC4E|nr:hypothetical protein [Burkholderia sp. AU31652]OXI91045.1 hypothetical protein CFB40_12125 [Burkholderia sp. AU31652]